MRIQERLALLKTDADRLADRHARDASPLQIGDVIVDVVSAIQEVARLAIIGLPPASETEMTVRKGDMSRTTVERRWDPLTVEMHRTLQEALDRGDSVRIEHCPPDQELPRPFDDRRQPVKLFDGWDWSARDQFDAGKMGWCLCSFDDGQIVIDTDSEHPREVADEHVRKVAAGEGTMMVVNPTVEQAELCRRAVMIADMSHRMVIGDRVVAARAEWVELAKDTLTQRGEASAAHPRAMARDLAFLISGTRL